MNFFMPTRLATGEGCLAAHAGELAALGSRCVVVTSGHAAVASGALADARAALDAAGVAHVLWDHVRENPPVADCAEAGRLAAEHEAQFVLGIGGGSALDAAKAVAVFAANPALDEAGFYALAWERDPLPIVLVGTTAGTGSEVTKVSVLTDAAHRKHSIHDDRLYATLAFGDSRYTRTCPVAVTLSCGVDVLAHATESYFSRKADDISRAAAVRAIRLAKDPLAFAGRGKGPKAHEDEVFDAYASGWCRQQLYDASILGGLAINTTGTCFPHNVGYYLTETYHVPHGFACAVFLPAMLDCVREDDPNYAAAFYDEIGMDEDSYRNLIEDDCLAAAGLEQIRMSMAEIEAALPRWQDNGSVKNTRADVTVDDIRAVLVNLFAD